MTMLIAVFVVGLTGQAPAAPAAAPVVLPPDSQIAAAVQAAPEERRGRRGAGV